MSGVKRSAIELEKERKAQHEALARIENLSRAVAATGEKIQTALREIPEGVKESFPSEVKKAGHWLGRSLPTVQKGMNSSQLTKVVRELERNLEEGKQVHHSVVEVKETRREARARELVARLEVSRGELAGWKELCSKWKQQAYEDLEGALDSLLPELDRGEFPTIEAKLAELSAKIHGVGQEVSLLESQDRLRRQVLEALSEVCREMGWDDEEKAAQLENEADPKSALLFQVNTFSAGRMEFRLTLEGIVVDSPYASGNDFCLSQFNGKDGVSERLRKFGIQTKFERAEPPDETPQLLQRGELDLPDEGIELVREA